LGLVSRRWQSVGWAVLGLSLVSCSLNRSAVTADYFRQNPPALFYHALQNGQNLRSLSGEGYLTLESPDGGFTGYARVDYRAPDSLLVALRTGYGLSVGKLLVKGQDVWLYNVRERVVYHSVGQDVPLEDWIGLKLSVNDLFAAVLGSPRLPPLGFTETVDSLRYSPQGKFIRYELRGTDEVRIYDADPQLGAIVRTQMVTLATFDTVECLYKNFRRIQHYFLPRQVQILRPKYRERLSFYYRRVTVNRKISPGIFELHLPEDVQIIQLGTL